MLTENDIKYIKGTHNKYFPLLKYIFIFLILFSVIGLGYNFYLAVSFAEVGGMDLAATTRFWNKEIILKNNYTGYELQSLHHLNMAILNLGLIIIFSIQLWSFTAERKRNKRILAQLVKCGSLQSD